MSCDPRMPESSPSPSFPAPIKASFLMRIRLSPFRSGLLDDAFVSAFMQTPLDTIWNWKSISNAVRGSAAGIVCRQETGTPRALPRDGGRQRRSVRPEDDKLVLGH